MNTAETKATAEVEASGEGILLRVGGTWRLTERLPELDAVMPGDVGGREIRVIPAELIEWDSSLPLFLLRVRSWCREKNVPLNLEALPDALKRLFRLISESEEQEPPVRTQARRLFSPAGALRHAASGWKESLRFVGQCAIGSAEVASYPRHFRWKDFFTEMVNAGPKAMPIIGLLSFLIGLTFAFETIMQLRRFGAEMYVIDAVGLAVVRQIGPVIAAVVLAGRTGAAFAAHLGDMKLGGEIDALEILGVSPVTFLVLPRVVALVLMMPLIGLYSDLLGVLGGLVIVMSKLDVPATEFWVRMQGSMTLTDVNVGLLKSVVFGLLVGLAGTLHGLRSERTSAGVGRAVTSAVVTGIAAVVTADALFAPLLQRLHL